MVKQKGGGKIMKLEIKNLIKMYGEREGIHIDDFKIEGINSLAIVGPSGGGKSTFLRVLATIEEAKSEVLKINDLDISDKKNESEYLKKSGYVFQHNNLFPNLSVLENVTIHLRYTYGMKEEEANNVAEQWLDKVGILEHKNKKPNEISGGQAQRAAIVRALVTGASLLLLDEPTSALDPKLAYEVMQSLLKIKEESDVIIVTHELNFARRFADYYMFIDDGKIISHGKIEELFNNSNEDINNFVKMVEFK